MPDISVFRFGPFRLDLDDERLWRETYPIRLTAKPFAVLRYLVEHAGQLATKEALFEAVWVTSYGSESSLASSIRDIRRALGDSVQAPQFIETVRGRGYRFIAPVTVDSLTRGNEDSSQSAPLPQEMIAQPRHSTPPLVGRDRDLSQLHDWFDTSLQGERQISFVMGEAGIGKTTLVENFLTEVALMQTVWVGYGQCIQQYGTGEAYLPLLEALGRLCRSPHGPQLVSLLRQQAPSWLAQLPAHLSESERESLHRQGNGTTRDRMLRELADAVITLTVDHPLVLVLEDLHWCDPSTLEWLAYMARRRDTARVLVVATYRPVDAIVNEHPAHALIQELRARSQCQILALDYWSEGDIGAYMKQQHPDTTLPTGFLRFLHQRTNGNPLFVVAVVGEFIRQQIQHQAAEYGDDPVSIRALARSIPDSLRQLIEHQFSQATPEEQRRLEAASVAGIEFTVATVEAAIEEPAEQLEACYSALARRQQFVQAHGLESWPDGTVSPCYRFIHALYQEVIYTRVSPGRCLDLHQKIGMRKEAGYGIQARDIATELAAHFINGHDSPRAVQYLHLAGENALRQSAHREAKTHLTQGLAHLQTLPETHGRIEQEVILQSTLGSVLSALNGSTSPEVELTYSRARILCQQLGHTATPLLLPVLRGLWFFYVNRTRFTTAQEIGEQLLLLAHRLQTPIYMLQAHVALGNVALWLGDFARANTHCQQGLSIDYTPQHDTLPFLYGEHPQVLALICLARTLWYLGYPEQALQRIQEAEAFAKELAQPISLAVILYHTTVIQRNRRDAQATATHAKQLRDIQSTHTFALWEPASQVELGWSQVVQGQPQTGLLNIREGLAALIDLKADIYRPAYLLLLAEAYGMVGQSNDGLECLAEAQKIIENPDLTTSSTNYYLAAEITRLKGELLLQLTASNAMKAEHLFHNALDLARRQQAKSWELRTATSLSRLWQQQGKRDEAYQLLNGVFSWFTEGFETSDLQDAKALLEALA